MCRYFVGSFVGLYIFVSCSMCYAQSVLPDVSVEDSVANRRALLSSFSPEQIINYKDIHILGLKDVAEALRLTNGVSVKDYGGLGGMKTVSIRNLGAEHTGVLYDGVPVSNCQAGQIDIARFSTENLSAIRMGIGSPTEMLIPASMEPYSGTLNMTTSQSSSWAKASYGSFNTLGTSANINHKRLNAFVNYNHTDGDYPFVLTNGMLKTNEVRNNGRVDAVNGELNYRMSFNEETDHRQTVETKAYYYYSDRGLPGGIILYNNEAHERLWDENSFVQTKYYAKIDKQLDIQALAKYNHSWNKYFDGNQIDDGGIAMHTYSYRQDETYISFGANYRVAKTADKLQISMVADQYWNTLLTNIPEYGRKHRSTTYSTLRARYHESFITANASILYTWLNEKTDRKKLTPSLSLCIRPFGYQELYLRASWRQAFRLPTFNDMYYYRMGNHDLRPERTNEYNLGITFSSNIGNGRLSLVADTYYNHINDLIVAFPTTFAWKMYNYGKVDAKGLNFSANYQCCSLDINIGYNYNDTENRTDRYASSYGKQIPYTARHSGNASVIWNNPIVNIGYSLQWMGVRYSSIMHDRRYRLGSFDDHNISLSRLFHIGGKQFDVSLMCKNILDCQYDIIKYYPMPGREYIVNVKYKI